MSRFRGKGVRKRETPTAVKHIISNFLIDNTITLIYAPPKQGKSMFLCGVSKWIYHNTSYYTEYYDFDNPLVALEDRGVDALWEELDDRFDYIHPEELEKSTKDEDVVIVDAKDVLNTLAKDADILNKNYEKTIFMFDSATDFCDESSDSSVKLFMSKLKRIRLAGGTVIILHHTNKKDPSYKGSTVFKSASDNIYKLTLEHEDSTGKTYILEKDDARFRVESCAFKLSKGYNLERVEYETATIPKHELDNIDRVIKVLKANNGSMKQGELLEKALDTKSTDKTAVRLLEKYIAKHWSCKKDGRTNIFTLI